MQSVTVGTLKLFGGHVALDLTNTVNARGADHGPDALQVYNDLLDWGVRVGLLGAAQAAPLRGTPADCGEAALQRAKALREALYRIFANAAPADAHDLELLERWVCMAQGARRLIARESGYLWGWDGSDPDTVSHRIALAGADLLVSPSVGRVRVCPGDNCGWLFLDSSRAGRRIWCSEETCGTRNRVRRWRSRRRRSG